MKKILFNLLVYTFCASLVCFFAGMFALPLPPLNESDILPYRLNNGFLCILLAMPSIVITGFLIGCAVSFRDAKIPLLSRFSPGIVKWFKMVLFISVVLTFGLSLSHDVGIPVLEQRKFDFEEKPRLIQLYLNVAEEYLEKNESGSEYVRLAMFYSKKVLELDAENKAAADLQRRAELADAMNKAADADTSKNTGLPNGIDSESEPIDTSEIMKIHSSSVYELVSEAERLFENGDYLAAHYYARIAVKFADGKGTNLERATECANRAWNILSDAQAEELTEENLFFRKKVEGYSKLIAGDFLSSYYIFQRLHNSSFEKARDTDVRRYLNISRYELSKSYFFIDETDNKDSFESAEKVYFSLPHDDGSYDVFFIKGITDINNAGGLVRYLRELSVYSFDAAGNFAGLMTVPYAKMLAVNSDSISDAKKRELGIKDDWKRIPYVILCSVDRDKEGVTISPVYQARTFERYEGPNQILLPMPFDDFSILSKCSVANPRLNIWNMTKMKIHPSVYGYSKEILAQSILMSIFYPFLMLIVLIFSACIGWNYRLRGDIPFKFVWIFMYPLVNLILYGAVVFLEFVIKLLNFIFIGIAGVKFALGAGLVFYLFWLVFVCVLFMSRKGD